VRHPYRRFEWGKDMKKSLILLLLAAVTLTSVGASASSNPKLSPDLQKATAPTVQVVVQYNQAPSLLDLNLLGLLGSILNSLPLVNGIVADLPLSNVLTLANQSKVK
jgi:hypothetical protein